MDSDRLASPNRENLLEIVRRARRRWRVKVAIRGIAALVLGSLLLLGGSIETLEFFRFSPGAIIALRILAAAGLTALVGWFVVRPLLRSVRDEQIALYLEELDPSFDATLVSAVDALRAGRFKDAAESPEFVDRLVAAAVARYEQDSAVRRAEGAPMRRYAATIAALGAIATALFVFGPEYLRYGARALFTLAGSVEAASPYRLEVSPGDTTVSRGADQAVSVALVGFQTDRVELVMRSGDTELFERVPLVPAAEGAGFEGILFDLTASTVYFAEAAGVRSPMFTLNVVDLPDVDRLELEYSFPTHTGLPPQHIESGSDIAVIRGTTVRLRVTPTMPTPGGRVRLHEAGEVLLARAQDGTLTGQFTVDRDGFYRIELDAPSGERVAASPQYAIDMLSDQPPSISFAKPGRDIKASPIEEIFVEARANDDFGLRQLDLVYSVNGEPEQSVRLFAGESAQPVTEISAGHTFYLEELGLEPGDFVSYYAQVVDNDTIEGPKLAMSDLFFMQVRPFRKEFRPAPSQAGGGGGMGGGAPVGALSQQQREIISGTFNVVRDRKTYTDEKFREDVVLVALAEGRLREQVEGLVGRMSSRLVEPDPAFRKIAEILPKAVEEMKAAEDRLRALTPEEALAAEQRALQHLQKAEEEYEVQVTMQSSAGGGGGGAGSIAEDLADLFELENDRLANRYEMVQRAEQQQRDQQLDELAERLRELARRQEQELERQRRGSARSAGSGGTRQRALVDEVEETARRLERLSREQERPDLAEAARRMQEAADAMRRAAANGSDGGVAQAGSALDRLREAQRELKREQVARAGRDVAQALRTAEALARDQREVASEVKELSQQAEPPPREQLDRLGRQKQNLEGRVGELEKRLDLTSSEIRRSEREAASKLSEGANAIRQGRIKEKIRYSNGVLSGGNAEYASMFEEDISSSLDRLRDTLTEAAAAVGKSNADAAAEALDRARDIARGLDSMSERLRERGGQQSGEASDGQEGGEGEGGGGLDGQGRQEAQGANGTGASEGLWGPGGTGGDRRPSPLSGNEVRQFRGEVRQWTSEVGELDRSLSELGMTPGDLDEILEALRALDRDRVYQDREELLRLQTFVAEGMKRFEYDLRRKLGSDTDEILLSGRDQVPPQFRELVEEYYRALSRPRREQN